MIQLKRATASSALNSYIPKAGQPVYDLTNHVLKIGNGANSFSGLPRIALDLSTTAQAKPANLYTILESGQTGQRNLGVQYYTGSEMRQFYLMYNSSTDYCALYHSKYGSVVSVNNGTGAMRFNGTAAKADTATNATRATTASNAEMLGGQPPSYYKDTIGTFASNYIFAGNSVICWGRFSSGTNMTSTASGNHYYQDVTLSSKIIFGKSFSAKPMLFLSSDTPTAEVVDIQPLSLIHI